MTLFERMRALPEDCRAALRRASAWAVLVALLDAVCGALLVPLVEAWFAEDASPWRWVAALLGLSLAQALLQYLVLRRGFTAGGSLAAGLVRSLMTRLPCLAPPALHRVTPAEGLLRGPVMQAMGIPAHLLEPPVAALMMPLGVIPGLFLIDPSITFGLLLAGAVFAALLHWSRRRNLAAEDARLTAERDAAQQLQTFAERQPLLCVVQRESVTRRELEEALHSLRRSTLELLQHSLPSDLGLALAVQAAFAFALFGGAWAVERQWLDGAWLVVVLVLLVRSIEPLAQLTHLDQALHGAWQALDTLLRVFALASLRSPEPGKRPHDASLAAKAVELRLEDGRALLEDISLRLEPGSLSVLVGPSGAGKSSLLALLGRLYDVGAGRVLLGGVDIRRLSETTLAASRSLVFQDNGLFRGSVAWNLRIVRADADLEALHEAAWAVGLLEEIEAWPQGWDSDVSPGDAPLSGDQRQHLCLACGLLSAAPLLLLDEPTASLNAANEAQVLRSLLRLRGRRTLLVVTHRPALARQANQVLLLGEGRPHLSGRRADLLVRDDWYAGFVGLAGEGSSATVVDR